jgi:thiol:disulfide interchange protein
MAALLCLAAALPPVAQPAAAAQEITWWGYEQGMNLSQSRNKGALIDFSTSWCSWCKKMDEETYSDPRVIEKSQRLVCIRVDGDARGDLVAQYSVDAYPTTIFLAPNGTEAHRVDGYKGPDDFLEDMDYVLGEGARPAGAEKSPCTFALLALLPIPAVMLVLPRRRRRA